MLFVSSNVTAYMMSRFHFRSGFLRKTACKTEKLEKGRLNKSVVLIYPTDEGGSENRKTWVPDHNYSKNLINTSEFIYAAVSLIRPIQQIVVKLSDPAES